MTCMSSVSHHLRDKGDRHAFGPSALRHTRPAYLPPLLAILWRRCCSLDEPATPHPLDGCRSGEEGRVESAQNAAGQDGTFVARGKRLTELSC